VSGSLSTCTEIILEVLKLNCKINEAIAEVNLKFNEELKDIIKVHPSLLSLSFYLFRRSSLKKAALGFCRFQFYSSLVFAR
jgi:hypothetical protein